MNEDTKAKSLETVRSVRGILFSLTKTFDDLIADLGGKPAEEAFFLPPSKRDEEILKELGKRVDASLVKAFDKNVRPPMEVLFEQWIEAEKGRRAAEERAKSFEEKYEEAREATRPIAEWFHDVNDTIEKLINKEKEQGDYVRQTSEAMIPLSEKYEYAIRTLTDLDSHIVGLPGWSGQETVRFRDELAALEKKTKEMESGLRALPDEILALPFTPDTHTGTRQAAMREAAARLVREKTSQWFGKTEST